MVPQSRLQVSLGRVGQSVSQAQPLLRFTMESRRWHMTHRGTGVAETQKTLLWIPTVEFHIIFTCHKIFFL